MNTSPAGPSELLSAVAEAGANLRNQLSLLDEARINALPFEGSWTAGQLVNHVTKATAGIAGAMRGEGTDAGRDPGARIEELKTLFLDFDHKMKSPDFIMPDEGRYDKERSLGGLEKAFAAVPAAAQGADLSQLVSGLPMGPVSRLEMLHFILYHTIRHDHQMQKICAAVNG